MKKTKIALAIASSLIATSAFATNGTNMTGVGAESVALGGTGTAAYYGAENVIVNPGMIGKSKGTEFSFGGTLFKPNVKTSNTSQPGASGTSAGDTYVIPAVSLSSRINDHLTFGIGMYGTSGMGVDYYDEPKLMRAQSNLQIMRFNPTLAYNTSSFGVGITPVLQYGSLDINYENPAGTTHGSGVSSDLGMGVNLGGYFDITKNFTLAASYQSAIDMKYKHQITTAAAGFVLTGLTDHLEQPAEMKVGAAYQMGAFTFTGDYKKVAWASAKGYKDFGWQDQDVIAVGTKYTGDGFWVGAGYNHGNNPIKEQNGNTPRGGKINMFNSIFFPAITENHYSIGGGYNLTKAVAIDTAFMYSPETSQTVNVAGAGMGKSTTKHSQTAFTVSARYDF